MCMYTQAEYFFPVKSSFACRQVQKESRSFALLESGQGKAFWLLGVGAGHQAQPKSIDYCLLTPICVNLKLYILILVQRNHKARNVLKSDVGHGRIVLNTVQKEAGLMNDNFQ